MRQLKLVILILCLANLGFAQDATPEKQDDPGRQTTRYLLHCLYHYEDGPCNFEYEQIVAELAKRNMSNKALEIYPRVTSEKKALIVEGLFTTRHDPHIRDFMERIAFNNLKQNEPDSEPRWYALQYLAEGCDERALQRLNGRQNFTEEGYPIGCMWWTSTIRTFGKCRYRPAIPHLIQSTNTVACLNISEAAYYSLLDFFPGKCTKTKTMDEMHDCFARIARTKP